MPQVSVSDCQKLLHLVGELNAVPHADSLPQEFLRALRPVIAYEFGGCHFIDPSRHQVSVCASGDDSARFQLPVQHKDYWRLAAQHPLHRVALAKHSRAWRLSDVVKRQNFQLTECYRTLYRPLGADFELAAALPDSTNTDAFLLINLHRHRTDFTQCDRQIFNLLLPELAAARQRLVAADRAQEKAAAESPLSDESRFKTWLRDRPQWELTHREADVLFWLCQGKTNNEIGRILGIAERTAETHALHIYPKIGVENRYNAIATLSRLANCPA